MMKETIIKLVQKQDLTYAEAYGTMQEIMAGKTSPIQNAAFLAALSTKSATAETIDEISGCGAAMRECAIPFDTHGLETMEIVGTGGDGSHSINISTTAAIVIASGGVPVTKHGNVAASSKCGTANVLDALGMDTHLAPEKMEQVLQEAGICFLHAQVYHTSMHYVGAIRKELGFRTVFNILGPITNPAKPKYQMLGVYDEYLLEPMAHVLTGLGVSRGAVVFGQDRLDEISISAPTSVCEFADGNYRTYTICPEQFGLSRASKDDIVGGEPAYNAKITRAILSGEERGAKRDVVLLNAGMGLYLAGRADSIGAGVQLAANLIDSGKAIAKLERWIAAIQKQKEGAL